MRGMSTNGDALAGSTNVAKLSSNYAERVNRLANTALYHFAEGNKEDAELASYEAGRLALVAGMDAPDSIRTNEVLTHAFEAGVKDCKQDEDDVIDFEEAEEYYEVISEYSNLQNEAA